MSRAFVKEQDIELGEAIADRPISPHPNFVTAEGLARIDADIIRLQQEHASAQAREDRGALARIARDLRYWAARRATAQVVDPPSDKAKVQFGSTVTLARDGDRRQTYRIVGEDEAEPSRGTLSYASPLARALTGRERGEVVAMGNAEYEIIEIA